MKKVEKTEKLNNRCAAASDKNQRVSKENGRKNSKRAREEEDENTDTDTDTDTDRYE